MMSTVCYCSCECMTSNCAVCMQSLTHTSLGRATQRRAVPRCGHGVRVAVGVVCAHHCRRIQQLRRRRGRVRLHRRAEPDAARVPAGMQARGCCVSFVVGSIGGAGFEGARVRVCLWVCACKCVRKYAWQDLSAEALLTAQESASGFIKYRHGACFAVFSVVSTLDHTLHIAPHNRTLGCCPS